MIRRSTSVCMALIMAGIGLRFVDVGRTHSFGESLGYYAAAAFFFLIAASMIRAIVRAVRNHGTVL